MKLSVQARVSLVVAVVIMLTLFGVQTAVVLGYFEPTLKIAQFGYGCVIGFMPLFFLVVVEFVRKSRYKSQSIDDTLIAINASSGLVEYDINGIIVATNENYAKLLGYSREELTGRDHGEFIDPLERRSAAYKYFYTNLGNGRFQAGEFKKITKSGAPVWIYSTYNPIKDPYGKTYKILQISSDITEKKMAESEVAKKNSYLEHAAKILRHDMHSGINTYIPRGLSSLKRRLTPEQIKELKIESPLKMMEEGLTHTQKVYKGVKEFTNLVKKEAQLEKQSLDLKEILLSYLGSTSYIKQVVIEDLVTVDVNEALFCTAIDNLIRNGLKYNDSDTKFVKLYMENKNTMIVQDNGRGMTQEEFINLSQPYIRRQNQKESGTGLGLNICIAIMNEHGFTVTAEKLNIGTKLRIKLS